MQHARTALATAPLQRSSSEEMWTLAIWIEARMSDGCRRDARAHRRLAPLRERQSMAAGTVGAPPPSPASPRLPFPVPRSCVSLHHVPCSCSASSSRPQTSHLPSPSPLWCVPRLPLLASLPSLSLHRRPPPPPHLCEVRLVVTSQWLELEEIRGRPEAALRLRALASAAGLRMTGDR